MTQEQFGLWAAIAIHDTSSVVGAGAAYGQKALGVATMVKNLTLWIIPLAFVTTFIFEENRIRYLFLVFILFFVLAMIANTYLSIPENISGSIVWAAKKGLTVTLFLIGAGLSRQVLKHVGINHLCRELCCGYL